MQNRWNFNNKGNLDSLAKPDAMASTAKDLTGELAGMIADA
jgi:hypothetical protein